MSRTSLPSRTRTAAALAAAVLGAAGLLVTGAGPASAATDDDVLTTGERLTEGDRLVSRGGRYALEVVDGELLLTERASDLAPERSELLLEEVATLLLQGDGNLVAFSASGAVSGSFDTGGTGATAVVVQDDRNIVFFGAAGQVVADASTYRYGYLGDGEAMQPGDVVPGEDGSTRLIMQLDGNLVLYRGTVPLWDSRTGVPGTGAVMQDDGNLVLYAPSPNGRRAVFATGSSLAGWPGTPAVLRVEDTEISVARLSYASPAYSIWSSNSRTAADPRGANGYLAPGDELEPGEFRVAGACKLIMEQAGNLIEYCDEPTRTGTRLVAPWGTAVPPSGSPAEGDVSGVAVMQADGNFVVYRLTGLLGIRGVTFSTGTGVPGSSLTLQTDRNVVVRAPGGRPTWSWATGRLG